MQGARKSAGERTSERTKERRTENENVNVPIDTINSVRHTAMETIRTVLM